MPSAWSRREKKLLGIFAITLIFNLFAWPSLSLIPVIGKDSLEPRTDAGSACSPAWRASARSPACWRSIFSAAAYYAKLYIYSVIAYLVALTAFAMLPTRRWRVSRCSLPALAVRVSPSRSRRWRFIPPEPEMRARILGLLSVSIGTGPIGFLQVGLLADAVGAQLAIIMAGAKDCSRCC